MDKLLTCTYGVYSSYIYRVTCQAFKNFNLPSYYDGSLSYDQTDHNVLMQYLKLIQT